MRDHVQRAIAEVSSALEEIGAEARRPITLEEISDLDDDEGLRSRVALRLLERYGWGDWPSASMPNSHRWWLATDALEAEWANGGLDQFVENYGDSLGRTLTAAIDGYAVLGSPKMARVAGDVLLVVQSEAEHVRRVDFEAGAHTGDALDIYTSESLSRLDSEVTPTGRERAAFVRANPNTFVG
jgi:hypothetical protein